MNEAVKEDAIEEGEKGQEHKKCNFSAVKEEIIKDGKEEKYKK